MMKNKLADAADATLLTFAVIGAIAAAIVIAGLIAVGMFESLKRYTGEGAYLASEQMKTDE